MATTFNLDLLNTIRNMASTSYQERIPQATRNNFSAIATAVTTHQETLNEFTGLVVKIGMQIFSTKMAKNPLERFKRGLYNGSDIEEIFVTMAKGSAFDANGSDLIDREKADIKTLYHKQNYQNKYKVTISDQQARNSFASGVDGGGLSTLMNQIVQSAYNGAIHDEFINMKNLLATYDGYATYEVEEPIDETKAKKFIKTVRKAVMDMTFMSDKYNGLGVMTRCDESEQVLIIHKDVLAEVDVEVLAKAFNLGKADWKTTIIPVDDFGSLADTYAILVDKEFYMMFDTLRTMESFRNADGLFTNYFLHVWQTQSLSKFKNAIKFSKPTA